MRYTPELANWIESLIIKYSIQLSIEKPQYVLRVKDVLALPVEVTKGRRTSAYRYYGVAYIKHNIVFFNVKRATSLIKLRKTITHELVHLRFPYLNHGKIFESKVKAVINGIYFKPYNKRRPKAIR